MERLTEYEINFIKYTHWCPTVEQCDEWASTIWGHEPTLAEIATACMHIGIPTVYDKISADIFMEELRRKTLNSDEDSISLENLAIYLFRTFLTAEERENLLRQPHAYEQGDYFIDAAAKWLKDWKYFCGFRKTDDGNYYLRMAMDENYQLVDDVGDPNEIWYLHIDPEEI